MFYGLNFRTVKELSSWDSNGELEDQSVFGEPLVFLCCLGCIIMILGLISGWGWTLGRV